MAAGKPSRSPGATNVPAFADRIRAAISVLSAAGGAVDVPLACQRVVLGRGRDPRRVHEVGDDLDASVLSRPLAYGVPEALADDGDRGRAPIHVAFEPAEHAQQASVRDHTEVARDVG